MEWSPNSQYLAVGTSIGIWVYSPSLEDVAFLENSTGRILDLDWFPDNSRLLSIDSTGKITIWNLADSTAETTASSAAGELQHLALKPDGTQFATLTKTLGTESLVQLWDTDTGEVLHTITLANTPLADLQWNRTGVFLAVSTFANEILVWNTAENWQEVSLKADGIRGESIEWSDQSGSYLMTDSQFGQLMLFDVAAREIVDVIESPNLKTFVWNDTADTVVYTQQNSNTLQILNLQSQSDEASSLAGHTSPPRIINGAANNKYDASVSTNGELIVWDLASLQIVAHNDLHLPAITLLALDTNSSTLAFLAGKCVSFWDFSTEIASTNREDLCYDVDVLAWQPNGETLAVGGIGGIQLWNQHQESSTFIPVENMEGSLVWSEDGSQLLLNARSGQHIGIFGLDLESGQLTPLGAELSDKNAAAFLVSPDRDQLGIVDSDASLVIWDMRQQQVLANLPSDGQRGVIGDFDANNLAWSPDGKYLAVLTYSNDFETQVWIWDLISRELANVVFNGKVILATAWSADSSLFVTANQDGSLDVWDTSTYSLLTTLQGHNDAVNTLTWLPSENYLVSGSSDGTVRLWNNKTK